MSWPNLVMLIASIPSFKDEKEKPEMISIGQLKDMFAKH